MQASEAVAVRSSVGLEKSDRKIGDIREIKLKRKRERSNLLQIELPHTIISAAIFLKEVLLNAIYSYHPVCNF